MTWKVIGLRQNVQRDIRQGALPEDLQNEFHALAEWACSLPDKFGDRVKVRLIDAASIEGFFKSLIRRVRRYPAFTVEGGRFIGSDFSRVDDLIANRLSARA